MPRKNSCKLGFIERKVKPTLKEILAMPTYYYKCECGETFEAQHRMSEALSYCPAKGAPNSPKRCENPGKGSATKDVTRNASTVAVHDKIGQRQQPEQQHSTVGTSQPPIVRHNNETDIVPPVGRSNSDSRHWRNFDELVRDLMSRLLSRLPENSREEMEPILKVYGNTNQQIGHMGAFTECVLNYMFVEMGAQAIEVNVKNKNPDNPDSSKGHGSDIDFCFKFSTSNKPVYVECASLNSSEMDKFFEKSKAAEEKMLAEYDEFIGKDKKELVFGNGWVFSFCGGRGDKNLSYNKAHEYSSKSYTEIFSNLEKKSDSEAENEQRKEIVRFIDNAVVVIDDLYFELRKPSQKENYSARPMVMASYGYRGKTIKDLQAKIIAKMHKKIGTSPDIDSPFILFFNCYGSLWQELFTTEERREVFNECFYEEPKGIFHKKSVKHLSAVILCGTSWPQFDLQIPMTLCGNQNALHPFHTIGLADNIPFDILDENGSIIETQISIFELLGQDKDEWENAISNRRKLQGGLQLPRNYENHG